MILSSNNFSTLYHQLWFFSIPYYAFLKPQENFFSSKALKNDDEIIIGRDEDSLK
jgi:hypothetical protein